MNQTLSAEWVSHFKDRFVVLVLDNEVTVDPFVTHPPLPWIRRVERGAVTPRNRNRGWAGTVFSLTFQAVG